MTTARVILSCSWLNGGDDKSVANDRDRRQEDTQDLEELVQQVATTELRESPAMREQVMKQLLVWIRQNPNIKVTRHDDNFLLRFLRLKKFSLPMAQQTLLKWLNFRKTFPAIAKTLDCFDSTTKNILDSGYIFVSPIRDSDGCKVIIYDIDKFDATKYNSFDMVRAHLIVYESLLEDEVNQVLGVVHVADAKGFSGPHVTCWNPTDFARIIKWGEQSIPMRHKKIHLLNMPTALKYIYDFACTRVSPKMSKRIIIHKNLASLHKTISPSCLPVNYGGTMTRDEMINRSRKELEAYRPKLIDFDTMDILNSTDIQTSRNRKSGKSEETSLQGSFRKLELD